LNQPESLFPAAGWGELQSCCPQNL